MFHHVLRHAGRLERCYSTQDVDLVIHSLILHESDPFPEAVEVENALGLNRVYVENSFCFWLVAERLVIACKTEDVAYPQSRSAQDIRLESNTVPISGDYLEHGVESFRLGQGTGGKPHR